MISTSSGVQLVLVRYGAVSEAARCRFETIVPPQRGAAVVLRTHRGPELGTVLDTLKSGAGAPVDEDFTGFEVERLADADDLSRHATLRQRAQSEFPHWCRRIDDWKIDLQLIDLEWTLDEAKLVLYVLNERGPECTKLAIQAVAGGFGSVEVQPVTSDGPLTVPTGGGGGGCGSGGGGCGCH